MKIAHIILAHGNPHQLKRLVSALDNKDDMIFVHIDLKCNLDDFLFLRMVQSVVLLPKRFNVQWGGYSLVEATISAFQAVFASEFTFDYINLISGQDFPIKSSSEFRRFLFHNNGRNFMEFHLPGHPWIDEARLRIERYHFTDYKFKGSTFLEGVANSILPKKKLPSGFAIIGHSGWFTLTTAAISYILAFFDANKSFVRKFKFSWGSDEFLIQSILYNSSFKETIVNDNLRYIDWSEGKASPKLLTLLDKNDIDKSPAFFARKFNFIVDNQILEYLEQKNSVTI
ncbi:MAG: beta-1,6-N-acetylglucosaminyltransferase [Bacteroidota bacterium]